MADCGMADGGVTGCGVADCGARTDGPLRDDAAWPHAQTSENREGLSSGGAIIQ
jgi:hypothetical protein